MGTKSVVEQTAGNLVVGIKPFAKGGRMVRVTKSKVDISRVRIGRESPQSGVFIHLVEPPWAGGNSFGSMN
jgi:hypothetical protein